MGFRSSRRRLCWRGGRRWRLQVQPGRMQEGFSRRTWLPGYLRRPLAKVISRQMERGTLFHVVVECVLPGDFPPDERLNIRVTRVGSGRPGEQSVCAAPDAHAEADVTVGLGDQVEADAEADDTLR